MTKTSIRRALAIMAGIVFALACIGNLVVTKFDKLPTEYLYILSGIILSYFFKNPMERLNGNNKPSS